jgi:hypothetical protein
LKYKTLVLMLSLAGLAECPVIACADEAPGNLRAMTATTSAWAVVAEQDSGASQAKIKAVPSNVISEPKAVSDAIESQSPEKNGRVQSQPLINNVPLSSFLNSPKKAPASVASKQDAPPGAPDTRPLWKLFNQQQYDRVEQDIAKLQSQYPDWKAPPELLALLAQKRREQRLEQVIREQDTAALVKLGEQYPEAFSCSAIDKAWALAAARASLGHHASLQSQLRHLVTQCEKEEDRLATLYKAEHWLARDEWEALIALGAGARRTARGDVLFQQLVYQNGIEALALALKQHNNAKVDSLFEQLQPEILARKDISQVLLVAWHDFKLERLAASQDLFTAALAMEPQNDNARYGLALVYARQQNYEEAIPLAQGLPAGDAGRNDLLLNAYLMKAKQAYEQKDSQQTLDYLQEAKQAGVLPRYALLMQAWSQFGLGNTAQAAEVFASLYRAQPDEESASGVMASYLKLDRPDEIASLATTEPLASQYRQHVAAGLFGQKRFFEARTLDPARYGEAGGIAAPQASAGIALRDKSGTEGLSQLSIRQVPLLEASMPTGRNGELNFSLREVSLDSGALSRNALVGSNSSGAWQYSPTTRTTGLEPRLSWRDDAWDIALGMTPDNGEVSSHPTGYVTHQNMGKLATLTSSLYIEPVRESILSYTGMRDPYTGKQWGRVLRNGVRLSSLQQLGNNWSLSGAINLEYLDGESVESNRHAGVFASVGKNLDLPAFSYAVVGLGFNYDHYEKNLSHFTLGHGGYFSPDRFVSIGPSFDFLSRENQQFIVKGRLAFASVSIAEAASPWFPGNDDGNTYAASKNNGMSYTAEASGVWRINDRLQIGGALSERNAPQYKDETGMLFLRVLFESRQSVLSTDLPTRTFNGLY